LKPTGAIVLTASQPFTTLLAQSNLSLFRYEIIWEKSRGTNYLQANKQPLKTHENILVFYGKLPTYNPIKTKGKPYKKVQRSNNHDGSTYHKDTRPEGFISMNGGERMPTSIINFENPNNDIIHPTEKPVGLFEYLIRTYSNENDLVFDGFGGSGTTAIAAHKSKRNFIVIEKEQKYFDLATRRLDDERTQLSLL
jgi:site-specific DNA-methyltransferase (adenine-specific)